MKESLILVALSLAALGSVAAIRLRPSATLPPEVLTKTRRIGLSDLDRATAAIDAAMARHDDVTAERLVDAALAGPLGRESPYRNGNVLHLSKARLLARRGADQEALAQYLGLLHNDYSRNAWAAWSPSPADLEPALNAALRLEQSQAVDEIATRIDEASRWHSPDFAFLNLEKPGRTSARRLAHAYVALSHNAAGDMKYAEEVRLCEKARALAPDEVPVLARLASAYQDRQGKGDLERAQALLRQAYLSSARGSIARRDLRLFGSDFGLDVAGEGATTTLQDDLGAYIREAPAREAARREAREKRRSEWTLRQGGPEIQSPRARP